MSTGLLLTLVGLALVDSTNFSTLGIPIYLLLATDRPARPVLTYLATLASAYFLAGAGLLLGLAALLDELAEVRQSDPVNWVQLGVGLTLVGLGIWIFVKRRARADQPNRLAPRIGGTRAMVLLGLSAATVGLPTLLPYLTAIGLLTAAGLTPAQWLPVLTGYVLIMVLPALLLLPLLRTFRPWLEPKLIKIRSRMNRHTTSTIGLVVATIGVVVAVGPVRHLFFS